MSFSNWDPAKEAAERKVNEKNVKQLQRCIESAVIATINDRKENKSKGIIIDSLSKLYSAEINSTDVKIGTVIDSKTKKPIFIPKGIQLMIPQLKVLRSFVNRGQGAPGVLLSHIKSISDKRLTSKTIRSDKNKAGTVLYKALVKIQFANTGISTKELDTFKQNIGIELSPNPAAIYRTLSRALQPYLTAPAASRMPTFFGAGKSNQPSLPSIVNNFLLGINTIADDQNKSDLRKYAEQQLLLNDFYVLIDKIDPAVTQSIANHIYRELGFIVDTNYPHPILIHGALGALGTSIDLSGINAQIPETGRQRWDGKTTQFDIGNDHLTHELTKMIGAELTIQLITNGLSSQAPEADRDRPASSGPSH